MDGNVKARPGARLEARPGARLEARPGWITLAGQLPWAEAAQRFLPIIGFVGGGLT
jgi:hypothetical protein